MMEDAAPGFGASLVPVVHVGTMAAAEIAKKKKVTKKELAWCGVALRHVHLATFSSTVLAVVCLLHLCK